MKLRVMIALALLAYPALAQAPQEAPRPPVRPGAAVPAAVSNLAPRVVARPPMRPAVSAAPAPEPTTQPSTPEPRGFVDPITAFMESIGAAGQRRAMEVPGGSPLAVLRSPRPERRPTTLPRTPAVIAPSPGGSVCGVASIKGQNLASIPGTLPGCGVTNPVRITEVAGVRLSQAATVDCTTAKALEFWTRKIAIPTVGRTGGGLARINVVVSYNCRKRIGTRSNRISEHGKGRAIDITGFTMRNGETFTVLKHWNSGTYGKILKLMHKGACGPFGTVLGPRANAAHRDHFHFDTARYRSGSYCR